jgi:hypothetical protein
MHIWLVELKFAILFLLNALFLMHFERLLTILLHLLERVPTWPNFSVFTSVVSQPGLTDFWLGLTRVEGI